MERFASRDKLKRMNFHLSALEHLSARSGTGGYFCNPCSSNKPHTDVPNEPQRVRAQLGEPSSEKCKIFCWCVSGQHSGDFLFQPSCFVNWVSGVWTLLFMHALCMLTSVCGMLFHIQVITEEFDFFIYLVYICWTITSNSTNPASPNPHKEISRCCPGDLAASKEWCVVW